MSVVVVTGTGTGVGKTVVTAALATLAQRNGQRVAVVKPGQTGRAIGEPGDLDEIRRLTGIDDLHEHARFPAPLAPAAAARVAGVAPLDLFQSAELIATLTNTHDLVLVEGAGGLLVRYDDSPSTIADLAGWLAAPVVVVVHASLGTLNHTDLTIRAMSEHKLDCHGIVIGSWPTKPDLAERCNLRDLELLTSAPLAGAIAENAGQLAPDKFLEVADLGLSPSLGGSFDAAAFRARFDPVTPEASP